MARSLLAAAVVLAWLNGMLVRTVAVNVQFFGETANRSDYRVAAGAGVTTALLMLLALLVAVAAEAPRWVLYLTGAGLATQLALGVTAWWSSRSVEDGVAVTKTFGDGVADVFLFPLSWPLLVVLVVAVVLRARSSRSPR